MVLIVLTVEFSSHRSWLVPVASKSEGQFIPEAERTRARGKEVS